MKHQFITIEGNIGAGKTTLAALLAKRLQSRLILEEFAENPFLQKFYEKPSEYAFPLELFFMAERYKQLKDLTNTPDLPERITVSDYLFTKCLLFAKINLPREEFSLYQKLFDIIHGQTVQADILIYLHAPVEILKENIKKRNRGYEQSISGEYLLKIQEAYTNFINQRHGQTFFIDATHADFAGNNGHLEMIVNALESDYAEGIHYFNLP